MRRQQSIRTGLVNALSGATFLIALLFAFFTVPFPFAWSLEQKPLKKPSVQELPISIEAQKARYEGTTKLQVYEGRVMLLQGKNIINADKIVVSNSDSRALVATATGAPVTFKIYNDKRNTWINGQADQVDFYNQRQQLVLRGNAILTRDNDVAQGETMTYDLNQETFTINSQGAADSKRVRITINPQELRKGRDSTTPPSQ